MRKLILILFLFTLASCQRGCTKIKRGFITTSRDYEVTMFSGGDTVFTDSFNGILNNSESSDGVYYYKDGHLIEISGDYVVKSK